MSELDATGDAAPRLANALEAAYVRHGYGPGEARAATAATIAWDAIRLDAAGELAPGAPEALAKSTFIPRAMRKELADRAMSAIPESNPAARTHAWLTVMGQRDMDAALGLGSGLMPTDVGKQVNAEIARQSEQAASTAERWAATAARLGRPGANPEDVL